MKSFSKSKSIFQRQPPPPSQGESSSAHVATGGGGPPPKANSERMMKIKGTRKLSKSKNFWSGRRVKGGGSKSSSTIQSSGSIHSIGDIIGGSDEIELSIAELSIPDDDEEYYRTSELNAFEEVVADDAAAGGPRHDDVEFQGDSSERVPAGLKAASMEDPPSRHSLPSGVGLGTYYSAVDPDPLGYPGAPALHLCASSATSDEEDERKMPSQDELSCKDAAGNDHRRSAASASAAPSIPIPVGTRQLIRIRQDRDDMRTERLAVESEIEEMAGRIHAMRTERLEPLDGDYGASSDGKPPLSWGRLGMKSRSSKGAVKQRDRREYQMGITSIQIAALQRELIWLKERESVAEHEYRRVYRKTFGEFPPVDENEDRRDGATTSSSDRHGVVS